MEQNLIQIPGSRVVLQPATWRDLNGLRQVEQVCFPKDAWPLWDLIGVLTLPNIIRLKAVDDGKMVGFIAADVRPGQPIAWIATVGVLPEYRGQGVGTALMRVCEERISVPSIRLNVRISNQEAIRLYEHLGYHQVGTWPGYYQDGEEALVMEKKKLQ
jgi:ribosomal-protein-alanine N-acetyltransferase